MIVSFRTKALARLYSDDNPRSIRPDLVRRVTQILSYLDTASTPQGLRLPGLDLHSLKGHLEGHWAVSVNANWRITFTFRDGNAHDVALVDYH